MKCQEVMESMQRSLDEELSQAEHEFVQEHIQSCASCMGMYERLNHLSDELVNLPKVVPPYSIVDSILPKLAEIDAQEPAQTKPTNVTAPSRWQKIMNSTHLRAWTGIAAAAVFLVLIVNQFSPFGGSNHSSMDQASMQESAGTVNSSGDQAIFSLSTTDDDDQVAEKNSAYDVQSKGEVEEIPPQEIVMLRSAPEAVDMGEISEEVGESYSIASDQPLMRSMTAVEAERIVSPDEMYVAFVEPSDEGWQVIIATHSDQERIYAGPLKEAERIQFVTWHAETNELIYEVATAETVSQFVIDVERRSEQVYVP